MVSIDVRAKEDFAKAHIPGAINIALAPSFASWVALLFSSEKAFTIVCDEETQVDKIRALPFFKNRELNFLNFSNWTGETIALTTLSVADLSSADYIIVDVRTESEWNEGHIPQAQFIPLTQFYEKFPQIPKDKDVAIICGSGYRSSIFASLLQKEGYTKVANVMGGMHAWEEVRRQQMDI